MTQAELRSKKIRLLLLVGQWAQCVLLVGQWAQCDDTNSEATLRYWCDSLDCSVAATCQQDIASKSTLQRMYLQLERA